MTLIEETLPAISLGETREIDEAVGRRWDSLTKPRGSLGDLETAVLRLARIQATPRPGVDRQAVYLFCGDHGVTAEGVSAYPSVVTREMMKNFLRGGAAINVLCRSLSIQTQVIDAGVTGPRIEGVIDRRAAEGTRNFAKEPAMTKGEALQSIERGIVEARVAAERYDLVGLGEMGIGNTTAATALLCALTGVSVDEATGRGTGLDDRGLQHKRKVISRALALHQVDASDPVAVLATFGGFEIAMMSGFLLGAAVARLPVVVDGFISSAAFLVARALAPELSDFVFFGHQSGEPGHRHLLDRVQAKPLLSLGMRLGEGTGAAMAMSMLRMAVNLYNDMSTFGEAAVSEQVGPTALS